ncbi:MAG: DUF2783 domain-containing protein [Proteobacteria bacterium]|nr:DUF2783 domain-containing protein [Pseudomonadota bacterium]
MTRLRTESATPDPDALYAALVDAHRDLDEAASAKLNAKLVLLLANHVGDLGVVREAIAAASVA